MSCVDKYTNGVSIPERLDLPIDVVVKWPLELWHLTPTEVSVACVIVLVVVWYDTQVMCVVVWCVPWILICCVNTYTYICIRDCTVCECVNRFEIPFDFRLLLNVSCCCRCWLELNSSRIFIIIWFISTVQDNYKYWFKVWIILILLIKCQWWYLEGGDFQAHSKGCDLSLPRRPLTN